MGMEEFTIKRESGPDMVFQGELLVRSELACRQPSAFGRWHNVRVYRRSDGMWVVQIDFNTLCLHERHRTEVEVVDHPEDVETVLSFHEATEFVNRRWIRPRYENDKRRFLKTLVKDYDSLVTSVLVAMAPYVEEYHARLPPVPHRVPRRGWRSFLEMVGIHQATEQFDEDPAPPNTASSTTRERSGS